MFAFPKVNNSIYLKTKPKAELQATPTIGVQLSNVHISLHFSPELQLVYPSAWMVDSPPQKQNRQKEKKKNLSQTKCLIYPTLSVLQLCL